MVPQSAHKITAKLSAILFEKLPVETNDALFLRQFVLFEVEILWQT
jgi:hypothetical protein